MTDDPTIATNSAAADLGAPSGAMTPTMASVRLKELEADKTWGERLQAGDPKTHAEFVSLTTLAASGDPLDQIMAGVAPNVAAIDETGGARASPQDQVEAVEDLRAKGVPDQAIRELLADRRPTLAEHEQGKKNQEANFRNPEWVERFMRGDPQAQRDFISNSWAIGCFEET